MTDYTRVRSDETIEKTALALEANGIHVVIVPDKEHANALVLEMIPQGAEVMTMTSTTLDQIGITPIINESGNYDSVRKKLDSMDRATQNSEMQKLGAAPEYSLGSVHGITKEGELIIASQTGSQLPGYAYASPHVIWVAGAQKISDDYESAMKRIEDYVLPLESERARKAYGVEGSAINKILVIRREVNPNRLNLILVKESLGF